MLPRGRVIGNTHQHVGESGARVDTVERRRGNELVHCSSSLHVAIVVGEEPALSAKSYIAQRALGRIVAQAIVPIIKEVHESSHRLSI